MVFVHISDDDSFGSDRMLNHFNEASVIHFRGKAFVEKAKRRAALLEKWLTNTPLNIPGSSVHPDIESGRFYYCFWADEEIGYDFHASILFNPDGNIVLNVYSVPEEIAEKLAQSKDPCIKVWY